MKARIIFALIVLGITSMAGQIVLMRELLIVFYGNELSLGITLASWLFWVAFGSWGIARWLICRLREKLLAFAALEVILAVILPISLLCVRFIPGILRFFPGEIIDILHMALATFLLLLPVCILAGFLFVLGCNVTPTVWCYMPEVSRGSEATQIGHVYILEAIGAAVGGLGTSLFLIRFLNPLSIAVLIGFLNLLSAFLLFCPRKILSIATAVVLAGFIFLVFSGAAARLNSYSLKKQWKPHELLASENSVYGNIALTKRQNLYSVFTNGLYDFSIPDKLTSERNSHFPLLEHTSPKDVLLIGGGSSGVLAEVLKHPVEKVDYVELDPLVINFSKKFLPENKALIDQRVNIITNMDGRLFIKRTDRKYDVVIINLPEPHTAQINRFYTREFYREVKNILKDKGILSFCLHSNPDYIGREEALLYLTLKSTLSDVFEDIKITPGEANFFLASSQKGALTLDWQILIKRLKERNIEAKYMREYYLFSELSKERIDFFKKSLRQSSPGPLSGINRDFHPVAYYYDMVLWSTYFKYNLKNLFKAITPGKIYRGAFCLYLILLIPLLIKVIRKKIPGWGVLTCVGTTGFAEITFQILTLLSFQVLYGYVYYKLGLVLTSYMIGLILGGWLITRKLETNALSTTSNHNLFIKTQVAIFIYPLILLPLLWVFSEMKGNFSFWLGSNLIFPFLPIIPGFIGGFQFPLANSLYIDSVTPLEKFSLMGPVKRQPHNLAKTGSSAGLTYGLDLFGSCLGAILTSVFLIPIIGIPMTCILTAGLNLAGLILLLTL